LVAFSDGWHSGRGERPIWSEIADKTRAFFIRLLTISFCEMKEVGGIPITRLQSWNQQGKGWP
jgi:hypothetical protein